MKIVLAKTAGFCMGVKRALDIALKSVEERKGPIYTHGPLIHNRQVVEMLGECGIEPADSFEDRRPGCVVIRAHGIAPDEIEKLRARGFEIVDATCPHVRRSQKTARRYSADGRQVIIVGDRDHAEIAGIQGWCQGPCAVVSSEQEAREVEIADRAVVIAQTTFSKESYERIAAILKERGGEVLVEDSICRATHDRQAEAAVLGRECDAVIVVGGGNSANTKRLAEIAAESGAPVYKIETADELDIEELKRFDRVGVTAGASTPSWITRQVIGRLEPLAAAPGHLFLRRCVSGFVKGNLYSSLAATALTFACCVMQGITFNILFLVIASCYIFSTSMLNRLFDAQEDKLHIPGRVWFYRMRARRFLVISLALIGISLGASLALQHGEITVPFLVAAYALGLTYSMKWIPVGRGLGRLKDIPGSKDLFGAAGWTAVAVFVPFFSSPDTGFNATTLITAAVAFTAVLVKSVLVDFADMYSDRRLGRETLPIVLGRGRTIALLFGLAALTAAIFAAAPWAEFFAPNFRWLGLYLLLSPVFVAASIQMVRRATVKGEVASILLADGNLLLLGLICAAYGCFAR